MIQSSEKPLQILSASAGSGKTYRLVLTYLELLFVSEKSEPFSHIVAMTFTNKAALEMKTRIIAALEIMSFPKQFDKSERKYEDILCERLKISPIELEKKAKTILLKILHRYEDFKVLTIDKFNLRLIRSFAKELDLPADFEVIIKEDEVLENVVDQLLNDVGTVEHEQITKLVLTYAKVKLAEGEKWNFRNDLIDFLGILKSEKHQETIEKLMLYEFTDGDFQSLQRAITKLQDEYRTELKVFLDYLDSIDFFNRNAEVSNGATTVKSVVKLKYLSKNEIAILTDSAFNHLSEGSKSKSPLENIPQFVTRFHEVSKRVSKELNLFLSIRNNYHNMWLLQLLAVRLEAMRKNDSLIRISEFNRLIGQLVQNEEAPFLYERLGNRYDHYLLDEFQDTSRMQWLNLVPLVHEGIAKMNLNFIVGDPKQSIYRFKNGIAEQFVVLPKIYNPDKDPLLAQKSAFFDDLGYKDKIDQNWRSTKTIVDFNNTLFKALGEELPEETRSFYDDIIQKPVSLETGYVHYQGWDKKQFPEAKDTEIDQILLWLDEIIADGFLPKDITILGRTNVECNRWAAHLIAKGYKVISADSLFVNSDIMVQWIISYLEKRRSPGIDNISKKFISQTLLVKRLSLSVYEEYLDDTEDLKYRRLNESKFITDFFNSDEEFYFNYQSIFDLIGKFCDLAKIDPLDNHYVHHLLDMAFQFDLRFGPDLQLFLEQYKQSGFKSPVQLPESDDALTIMSIHKSKGLEFPVVILPNISMGNPEKDKQKYYVEIEGRPSLLDGKKTATIEGYEHYPEMEANQIKTDNLNMYYVAFTRAEKRLYVRNVYDTQSEKNQEKGFKEEEKMHEALLSHFSTGWNADQTELKLGERLPKNTSDEHQNSLQQEFTPKSLRDFLWFPSIALEKNNRQEEYTMSDAQLFGNQFHLLLSEVESKAEIETKLNYLIDQGEVDFANRTRIAEEASQIFDTFLTELYSNANEVLSEKNILFKGEKNSRPDKILVHGKTATVIDFKTGDKRKTHEKQIRHYGDLLAKMGYDSIKKGLLYTETSEMLWVD
jgi:ATP-dependent exoDNAse (exonuclease V) beta subunit